MPKLFFLFLFPFIAAALIAFLRNVSGRLLKGICLTLSLIPLLMLCLQTSDWIGADINYPWMPALSINFHLHVDALSLLFLFLTAIVIPVSIASVNARQLPHPHTFFSLIFFLEGLLFGFFTARDLALFTILWEAMLIPLYFLITAWGGTERRTAALKFLIYMIAGSVLMVVSVLALYFASGGTFNLDALAKTASSLPHVTWIFAIFLIAFAVKTPLFPFHAWLPDAYCQAPTAGTILLSAILSKAGVYGILRIGMELFSEQMKMSSPLLLGLAIAGVFYGGLAAWMQTDFKRLIAYSSLSHINFVLAGLFVWESPAHSGAVLQALNHGVTIAALFLVSGWLEERLGSTSMKSVSGLAQFLPTLCWLTLFFVLSSVALPGTNNFVGELMILFGLFKEHPFVTAFLALTVILSVIYMLRWMQKVYFEAPSFFQNRWIDIHSKELLYALPLIALILWIGIYPEPVLNIISKTQL